MKKNFNKERDTSGNRSLCIFTAFGYRKMWVFMCVVFTVTCTRYGAQASFLCTSTTIFTDRSVTIRCGYKNSDIRELSLHWAGATRENTVTKTRMPMHDGCRTVYIGIYIDGCWASSAQNTSGETQIMFFTNLTKRDYGRLTVYAYNNFSVAGYQVLDFYYPLECVIAWTCDDIIKTVCILNENIVCDVTKMSWHTRGESESDGMFLEYSSKYSETTSTRYPIGFKTTGRGQEYFSALPSNIKLKKIQCVVKGAYSQNASLNRTVSPSYAKTQLVRKPCFWGRTERVVTTGKYCDRRGKVTDTTLTLACLLAFIACSFTYFFCIKFAPLIKKICII